jgi:hypothetical protein
MHDLGIDPLFSSRMVQWDDAEIPMKDTPAAEKEIFHIADSVSVDEATKHLKMILDARYTKADLDEICCEQAQLIPSKQIC